MLSTIFTFPLLPEIALLFMTCVILLADLFLPEDRKYWVFGLSQFSLLLSCVLLALLWGPVQLSMGGHFILDGLAVLLKGLGFLAAFMVFTYAYPYLKRYKIPFGEYYCLALFSVLGLCVLISSGTMLSLYLGLELLSLPLYAMVAMDRDFKDAAEAALKYFVLGSLASGIFLYGISLLYGVTGSIELHEIARLVGERQDSVLLAAMIFIIAGLIFKFGAVPFHMWVPDVYQGSPTSTALFISSAPKIAAFTITVRVLQQALPGLQSSWVPMLMAISIFSSSV